MTKQQLLDEASAFGVAIESRVRCIRTTLPTLTAIAVAIASTVVLTLSGCASSRGIESTAKTIAPASVGLDDSTAAPAIATDWWKSFGDPTLDSVVERALAGNPNIRVAQARFERARAVVAGARSADGVQVTGQADATREHFSANGIFPPPLGGNTYTIGNAQISARYDFDFFGRNRTAIEAALGSQRAAAAEAQSARIALATSVARTYVQIGRLFEQREVAARSLAQREQVLSLIRQRVSGGIDTNVELRQGEGSLPESRELIEQLDEQIALARHALAALTAQKPDAYDQLVVPLATVHALDVPASLPADILGRRADVAAARWRVEAATSDVKNAKAGFYPNVNLTAVGAFNSIGLENLVQWSSRQWNVGPAISLPIFDAGRLRANLAGRTADLDAAIESYNGTVIDAVHDAADQVTSVRSIARQQAEQQLAQQAAESAYDLATQRYRAGLGTYLTVLNAESTVLAQRRLAADLRARALDVQILLIRALGGGYTEAEVQTASAAH